MFPMVIADETNSSLQKRQKKKLSTKVSLLSANYVTIG